MTKKLFSILRYTSIVASVASLFIISGCGGDAKEPVPTMNIKDLIASAEFKQSATVDKSLALDSASKYLNLYPSLVTLISGTTEYTLFAPSNEAFVNLLATPGFPSKISLIDPKIIEGVLSYHFVAGKKLSADLVAGTVLNSLYSETVYVTPASPTLPAVQTITVNADLSLKTGSINQAIKINTKDKKATNGAVQVVQSVMIPPSTAAVLTPILGTMAGTILLGKDFTQLAKIIIAADKIVTGTTVKITTYLAMPSANYPGGKGGTFFASPNAVLTDATVTALTSATDKGRSFLLNHLVAGKYGVAAGTDITVMSTTGQTFNPFSNTPNTPKTITVIRAPVGATNPNGVIVTTGAATDQTKYAPIFVKDLAHSNGLVQVIGGVLQ